MVRPGRDGNDRRLITMTRGLRQKRTVITRLIIVVQTECDLVRLNVRDRLAALWQRPLSESMEIYGIFMRDKRLSGLIKACRNRKLSAQTRNLEPSKPGSLPASLLATAHGNFDSPLSVNWDSGNAPNVLSCLCCTIPTVIFSRSSCELSQCGGLDELWTPLLHDSHWHFTISIVAKYHPPSSTFHLLSVN